MLPPNWGTGGGQLYNLLPFNLRLLLTTDTELSAMAAPAIIGLSIKPQIGYKTPAATGIPITL